MPMFGWLFYFLAVSFVDESIGSNEWIYVKPPPIPTITATVKTSTWQLISETTRHKSSILYVLENSHLTVVCSAVYPVRWKLIGNGKPLPETYSGPSVAANEFELKAAETYQATLVYPKVSSDIVGTYACGMDPKPSLSISSEFESSNFLTTEIYLKFRPISNDIKTVQILQDGFSVISAHPSSQYRYWASNIRISIIHSIPHGADLEYSLESPDAAKACFQKPSTFVYPTGPMTTQNKTVSNDTGQFTAIMHTSSIVCRGYHTFVIRDRAKNGSEARSQFFIWTETMSSRVLEADKMSRTESSAMLARRWPYELRLYIDQPLVINEAILKLENRRQEAYCEPGPVPTSLAPEVCGVYGFSLFQDGDDSKGVTLMVTAWSSCTFTVVINPHSNYSVTSTLYTTVFSFAPTSFTDVFNGPKVTGQVGGTGEEVTSGVPLFGNTSLTLNCLMPACHLYWVTWVRVGDAYSLWPPLPNTALGTSYTFPHNGIVTVVNGNWNGADNQFSMTYVLRFDKLTPDIEGIYKCTAFKPSSRDQLPLDPPEAAFQITLKGYKGPSFLNKNQTEVVLPNDGMITLNCKPDGDPKPAITWAWQSHADINRTDLNETDETIIVQKPGRYWCIARNRVGENETVFVVRQEAATTGPVTSQSQVNLLPLAIAIPIVLALIALGYIIFKFCKRKAINASFKNLENMLKRSQASSIPIDESAFLNDQVQNLPYNPGLEIDRNSFTITDKMLGCGEFGCIYKGELKSDTGDIQIVAVKMPRDTLNFQAYRELMDEVKIMSYIRSHVNVISLIGACTQNVEKRELFVLIEFCENGSLRDYLIRHTMKFEGFKVNAIGQFVGSPGAVDALLNYAYQAANGMSYLAAQKIIHRDLALRNLLLTNAHIVKISDFGMSRQNMKSAVYKKRLSADVPVPIFWMALESLLNDQYTQKSDVWSFGIVLWEMFSCGKRPYPDRQQDFSIRSWLRASESNRMGPPAIACEEMYHLMLNCWKEDPEARPTFSECKRIISRMFEQFSPDMYRSTTISLSEAWLNVPVAEGRSSPSTVFAYGKPDSRKSSQVNLKAEEATEKTQTSGAIFKPITPMESGVSFEPIKPTEAAPQIPEVVIQGETEDIEGNDIELMTIGDYSRGFSPVQPEGSLGSH